MLLRNGLHAVQQLGSTRRRLYFLPRVPYERRQHTPDGCTAFPTQGNSPRCQVVLKPGAALLERLIRRKDGIIMQITSFKDLYIAELQEMRSLEGQLGEAFIRMAEVASNPTLKSVLTDQRGQALAQEQRLGSMLSRHDADPRVHTDQAMQALVGEAEKMLTMVKGNDLRDAAMIASAQKIGHYQIAAYGTAAALAGQLDLRDDQRTLRQSLEEEKDADKALTQLAKGEVNHDAVAA
jgi:ferritin-like metal-binding protein YciE